MKDYIVHTNLSGAKFHKPLTYREYVEAVLVTMREQGNRRAAELVHTRGRKLRRFIQRLQTSKSDDKFYTEVRVAVAKLRLKE